MTQYARTVMLAIGCQPRFLEEVLSVTYNLIIVANNNPYMNDSSVRRSSQLLGYPQKKRKRIIFHNILAVTQKFATQQVARIGDLLAKILRSKRAKPNKCRNFGKKRRKQSKAYSYKLSSSYTQSSTTEFRRRISKNEGAPVKLEVTDRSIFVRRLIQRFTNVVVFSTGRVTRVVSDVTSRKRSDSKETPDHGKSPCSKAKNEGVHFSKLREIGKFLKLTARKVLWIQNESQERGTNHTQIESKDPLLAGPYKVCIDNNIAVSNMDQW